MARRSDHPHLGLVCITFSDECRYRAMTRARFLSFSPAEQENALRELYWANLHRLHKAISFCARRDIRLYRMSSGLFPMSDEPLGIALLESMRANLSSVGRRLARLQIRMTNHPDQFVVLNSESSKVIDTSIGILEKHARAFDLMGLPRSPWASITIHGGRRGAADRLIESIRRLPESVRSRLTLENDEYAFGADDILRICKATGVPMVFDAHHHLIFEKLDSYEHPSVATFTKLGANTWPDPTWQLVHLSNGKGAIDDRNHSELIRTVPSAYERVPWIDIEAKGKERAIEDLRNTWPNAKVTGVRGED